ncbi:MAG: TIGR02757 family protein [Bacteroidales bacterium]|nr:TIGR02757 family protein [Bacteroidales bacterium]
MKKSEIKPFLETYVDYFNQPSFIASDPIQVPHSLSKSEDIEIAGFLTATLAWGQRPVMIRNAFALIDSMPDGPFQFLMEADEDDLMFFNSFTHRTFNGTDCIFFLTSLQNIYRNHGGLKEVFEQGFHDTGNIPGAIMHFRNVFFNIPFPSRSLKHIADVQNNAAGKRINMFLRWMVRKDTKGVDFGLWDIPASSLYIPLDLHSGKVARELGLLKRSQNDWKAVRELTFRLREFDPADPVKYDFALYGLSALGKNYNHAQ